MDTEPRILIVDDETNILRSMEKTLLREGFDVETAGGNIEAYGLYQTAMADGDPFQLVIIDLNMPNFDGVGALRRAATAGAAEKPNPAPAHYCQLGLG
jgi:DNA-binding response OmpR family regulator